MRDEISALLKAGTIAEIWDVYCGFVARCGFGKLIYGTARGDDQGGLEDARHALILHRLPTEYADTYLGEKLYLHSPAYAWAQEHRGACPCPEAERLYRAARPSPEQARIAELNDRFHLHAGYLISLRQGQHGLRGVIALCPTEADDQAIADAAWARHGDDIMLVSDVMHLKISVMPQTGTGRPLTRRQWETLRWIAEGKTIQDIAAIMELSTATVEKHLRMAREALNASTTAHAVQKAVSLNLLSD